MIDIHVLFNGRSWTIRTNEKTLSVHNTREVALERARRLAKRRRARLLLHDKTGKVAVTEG